MKIELTEEQSAKMALVFKTLDELRNDKKFMKLLVHVTSADFNDEEVNAENEDDYAELVNFYDNLNDYANNYFNTFD